MHATVYHYFLLLYPSRRRQADGELFSHSQNRGGMEGKLLLALSFSFFCCKFHTEWVKTPLKTKHLKYLRLKTIVTNKFSQKSTSFPASFSEKNFWEIFSVLLSIFLIHCFRAMKLVFDGSNVPVQLKARLKIVQLAHISRAFGSFHRRFFSFSFQHSST